MSWTYVPSCECARCTSHHDATCAEWRAWTARWADARADGSEAAEYDAVTAPDCGCPQVAGAVAEHAAWAHPATPVRS